MYDRVWRSCKKKRWSFVRCFKSSKVNLKRIQRCLHSGRIMVTWLNFFCNSSKLKELVIGRCICYVCQQCFRISTPWTGRIMHIRYIPVHAASQELGGKMCLALPAFHAITSCDSTSALCGIGKKKGWKVLLQSEKHQDSLGLLGSQGNLDSNIVSQLEAFICDLYPSTKKVPRTSVN